jgi:hypothetical protein
VVKDVIYHADMVEVKVPQCTLIFTMKEWEGAIRRGKGVLRNRQAKKREDKRVQETVDDMMDFPSFQ